MSSAKKITLKSSDHQLFEVEESVALQSQTIKNMMEDVSDDNAIPLPNVTGIILAKVIEYCKRHVPPPASKKSSSEEGSNSAADADKSSSDAGGADLKAFDSDFVKVDHHILFDLILAANYLDIKSLLDLTCQAVADLIKDMKVEDVRTFFNITNDFTKEEEEQVRNENAWAFQE